MCRGVLSVSGALFRGDGYGELVCRGNHGRDRVDCGVMPKITSRVPGSFVAILVVTPIVAFLLPEGAVTTIGSEFGEIKCNLTPVFPSIEWDQLSHYLQPAMTIAF